MKKFTLLLLLLINVIYSYSQPAITWQKSLGGTGQESAGSIQQTTDGGYIVAGRSDSNDGDVTGNHGLYDYWIVKLNNIGTIGWQKSLGGTNLDLATSIQQTSDGGYVIAGWSESNNGDVTGNHGGVDYWIVKLSNTGSIQWQKSLGGTGSDQANSIQQTTDGGYIIAGYSTSNNGDVTGNHGVADYWIVKLTNTGSIQWQKSLGGTNLDAAASIQQTADGGYIVTGSSQSTNNGDVTGQHGSGTTSDYWIVKLTNTGSIVWQNCYGGTGIDYGTSIQQTTDGGYITVGDTYLNGASTDGDVTANHGMNDYWVVKLSNTLSTNESVTQKLVSIYPNPARNEIYVHTIENNLDLPYIIYDQSGRSVLTGKLNEYDSIIRIQSLSKGTYILSVGNKIKTNTKIIKE